MLKLLDIKELNIIDGNDYIVIRINGLYGDALNACCKLRIILDKFPNTPWIIIHSYGNKDKVLESMILFQYWMNNGKIKYYFHDNFAGSSLLNPNIRKKLNSLNIPDERIYDFYVFRHTYRFKTEPLIGIDIPVKKDLNKCIIFRYSGWHGHFPSRNRPYEEWKQYEITLLNKGYNIYLLGKDDNMPLTSDSIIDLRNKFNIYQLLDFVKDSSLCLTTTTFLYVWTQFICKTLVFADKGDIHNLTRFWKFTNNVHLFNTSGPLVQRTIHFIRTSKK